MNVHDPNLHHRRSIRLKNYDYRQTGAYFVTICAWKRSCLFGAVVDGTMELSDYGRIVNECWHGLDRHFVGITLDAVVVMPNHMHGIIMISAQRAADGRGEAFGGDSLGKGSQLAAIPVTRFLPPNASPLRLEYAPHGTESGSLAAIVQNLKSVSARRINQLRSTPGATVWQRNYYEHVIRDDEDMNALREYVAENPLKWELDQLHPDNASAW